MKPLSHILRIALLLVAAGFSACEDEKDRYGDLRLDLVTCDYTDGTLHFKRPQTDNREYTLVPVPEYSAQVVQGERVALYYEPSTTVSGMEIPVTVRGIAPIHFDTLQGTSRIDLLADDEVRLQSVWKTGDFLNFRYQIEYLCGPHRMLLVADRNRLNESDTLKVELRHDRRNDPEGYWSTVYSSFNIEFARRNDYKVLQVYVNNINYPDKLYFFDLKP